MALRKTYHMHLINKTALGRAYALKVQLFTVNHLNPRPSPTQIVMLIPYFGILRLKYPRRMKPSIPTRIMRWNSLGIGAQELCYRGWQYEGATVVAKDTKKRGEKRDDEAQERRHTLEKNDSTNQWPTPCLRIEYRLRVGLLYCLGYSKTECAELESVWSCDIVDNGSYHVN